MLEKIKIDGECWLWTGNEGDAVPREYGLLTVGGKSRQAHYITWEHYNGPVPPGREVDHLCRRTRCVNPDHLEPVTSSENKRRGDKGVRRLVCKRGHWVLGDNVRTEVHPGGKVGRYCRECDKLHRPPRTTWPSTRLLCRRGHWVLGDNVRAIRTRMRRECRTCADERWERFAEAHPDYDRHTRLYWSRKEGAV